VSEPLQEHSVAEAVEIPKKADSETATALPSIRPPYHSLLTIFRHSLTKMCPTYCIMALVDGKQQAINCLAVKTAGVTQIGKEGRAMLLIMAS
jgi:hypothetical protein